MIRGDSTYHIVYENKVTVLFVETFSESEITWRENEFTLDTKNKKVYISDEWKPYIKFDKKTKLGRYTDISLSFKSDINLNTFNARGQTLLYLAALNCNKIMFDALVGMGVKFLDKNIDDSLKKDGEDHIIGTNIDGSTILHGIAWGKTDASGIPTKTYDEKVAFIQYILKIHPDTILLLFLKNSRQETFYDNLLMRHPDKMSLSLYPLKWVRDRDSSKPVGDKQEYYFFNMDVENSSTYKHPST